MHDMKGRILKFGDFIAFKRSDKIDGRQVGEIVGLTEGSSTCNVEALYAQVGEPITHGMRPSGVVRLIGSVLHIHEVKFQWLDSDKVELVETSDGSTLESRLAVGFGG